MIRHKAFRVILVLVLASISSTAFAFAQNYASGTKPGDMYYYRVTVTSNDPAFIDSASGSLYLQTASVQVDITASGSLTAIFSLKDGTTTTSDSGPITYTAPDYTTPYVFCYFVYPANLTENDKLVGLFGDVLGQSWPTVNSTEYREYGGTYIRETNFVGLNLMGIGSASSLYDEHDNIYFDKVNGALVQLTKLMVEVANSSLVTTFDVLLTSTNAFGMVNPTLPPQTATLQPSPSTAQSTSQPSPQLSTPEFSSMLMISLLMTAALIAAVASKKQPK